MYKIKKISDIDILFINDQPAVCPFKNSIAIQGSLNQLELVGNDCNSRCPFFKKNDSNNLTFLCKNVTVDLTNDLIIDL